MTDSLLDPNSVVDQFDENKDWYSELVGDGKKFTDVKALAKGKAESDAYIQTLTRRMDELRDDYMKLREDSTSRANMKELVEQFKQTLTSSAQPKANEAEITQQPKSIDPKEFESLIDTRLTQREQERRQAENLKLVRDKLTERLGPNYQPALTKLVDELGLNNIDDMAKNSPKVLIRALGLDQAPVIDPFQSPPRSGQTFAPRGAQKRSWAWYQNLKKNDPDTYWKPETAVQMHEDAERLGPEFEDGDFHDPRFSNRKQRFVLQ